MFRNYLAAAFANLARNERYAAINVGGLAAAIVVGLIVRDECSYGRWIPGYERTHLLSEIATPPGGLRPQTFDPALATVVSHALRVASAKPVGALRYE